MSEMSNQLFAVAKHARTYRAKGTIGTLLRELGMPKSKCPGRGFWDQSRLELEHTLAHAKEIYDARIVEVMPRAATDDGSAAQRLNELWQKINERFDRKLNPQLVPIARASFAPSEPRPRLKPGHVWQVCGCGCGIQFERLETDGRRKYVDKEHCKLALSNSRRSKFAEKVRCAWHKCHVWFIRRRRRQIYHQRRCCLNARMAKYCELHPEARRRHVANHRARLTPEERRLKDQKSIRGVKVPWSEWYASISETRKERYRQMFRLKARRRLNQPKVMNPVVNVITALMLFFCLSVRADETNAPVKTDSLPLPFLPRLLAAPPAMYSATFLWTPSTNAVRECWLSWGVNSGSYTNTLKVSPTNAATVTNLVGGVKYYLVVNELIATKSGTNTVMRVGLPSNEIAFTVPSQPPVPPQLVTVEVSTAPATTGPFVVIYRVTYTNPTAPMEVFRATVTKSP